MINRMPPELFVQPPVRSEFVRKRRFARLKIRLIALVLLTVAIAGTGAYWTFKDRESSLPTEIPTIRADGPAKMRPDDPGGIDIPHQNETVFQQIDNTAPAKLANVEHLLPPPPEPQPIESSASDPLLTPLPPSLHDDQAKLEEVLLASQPETLASETEQPAAKPPAVETLKPPSAQALMESPVKSPVNKTEELPLPKAVSAPAAKPVQTAQLARTPKDATASATAQKFTIQVGSFPDQKVAQDAMRKIQSRYAGSLAGTKLNLVRADLGERGAFYRVQGGPMTDAEARSICAKLRGERAACIVVRR